MFPCSAPGKVLIVNNYTCHPVDYNTHSEQYSDGRLRIGGVRSIYLSATYYADVEFLGRGLFVIVINVVWKQKVVGRWGGGSPDVPCNGKIF